MGGGVLLSQVILFVLEGSLSQQLLQARAASEHDSCRDSTLRCALVDDGLGSPNEHVNALQVGVDKVLGQGQFMDRNGRSGMRQALSHDVDGAVGSTCDELVNKGSYFTMEVEVGNPKQKFNLIPDTGSNALVIPSCDCVAGGRCGVLEDCFNTGKSESFKDVNMSAWAKENRSNLTQIINGSSWDDDPESKYAVISYGSGPIACSLGSDEVAIGDASATLQEGVWLMESRTLLQVHDTFEGIMGLGLPQALPDEPLFMERAKIDRYSMCYNDGGANGVLRMNVSKLKNPLGNIGKLHWGLDLQGMSVGNETSSGSVLFCGKDEKKKGMISACGAIPDSGTTMIAGPADHISKLFESICDQWPRCSKEAKKSKEQAPSDPFGDGVDPFANPFVFPSGFSQKPFILLKLLSECGEWLKEGEDINEELPSITVHLAGASGEKHNVELSPWSYLVETDRPKLKKIHKKIFGGLGIDIMVPDANNTVKTCTPAFQPTEYITQLNGPVWILGNALFYDKVVSYDIGADPPAISIDEGECEPCKTSLLSPSSSRQRPARPLRRLEEWRESSIDTTKPL